jgi:hypothetical protein
MLKSEQKTQNFRDSCRERHYSDAGDDRKKSHFIKINKTMLFYTNEKNFLSAILPRLKEIIPGS